MNIFYSTRVIIAPEASIFSLIVSINGPVKIIIDPASNLISSKPGFIALVSCTPGTYRMIVFNQYYAGVDTGSLSWANRFLRSS